MPETPSRVTRVAPAALSAVLALALLPALVGAQAPAASASRPLIIADIDRVATVRDPQRSPDGGGSPTRSARSTSRRTSRTPTCGW